MSNNIGIPDWLKCCIVHDGKSPKAKSWQLNPESEQELTTALSKSMGIGALTGPLSNGLVIIDLDGFDQEMYEIADRELPQTNFMAGRGNNLTRHRGYFITDPSFPDSVLPKIGSEVRHEMDAKNYPRFPGKKRFKGERNGIEFAIEILAAGNQAVIPPSYHPSGERRMWHGGKAGEPTSIAYNDIVNIVEQLFVILGGKIGNKDIRNQNAFPITNNSEDYSSLLSIDAKPPHPTDFDNFKLDINRSSPAIQGQGGYYRTFGICCLAGDYNIPLEYAWVVIKTWNFTNCPPWNEAELKKKLKESYISGRSLQLGYKSIVNGAVHYGTDSVTNAKVFCDKNYPENTILFYDGDYYHCKFPKWEKIRKDTIDHLVQLEFEGRLLDGKPVKQSHIKDVSTGVKNRIPRPIIPHVPCWLSTPDKDTSGLIVTRNTLIEIDYRSSNFNIKTIPHTRSLFTLSHLPYDYDSSAECSEWHNFLISLWGENSDNALLLQEWFGYCLINNYDFQKIMLIIGKSRGGKGVIGRMEGKLVGEDNSCAFSFSNFIEDFGLSEMLNKRVAVFGDVQTVSKAYRDKAKGILLSISGYDKQSINQKYKQIKTRHIEARMTLLANGMPTFIDNSGALANRLLVLPITKSFAGNENTNLEKDKLIPELPGILNWSLEGLERLMRVGKFTKNIDGEKLLQEIRQTTNPVGTFLEHCCEYPYSGAFTTTDDLYLAYNKYMRSINRNILDKNSFLSALRSEAPEIGKTQRRVNGSQKNGYTNIILKQDFSG